jgi:hypothetical protein
MSIKRIAIILVIFIIGLYLFFNVLPIVIVPPLSVYHIYNSDEIDHHITVEILDDNNESILIRNYTLAPKASVGLDREINWHIPFTSSFVSWNDKTYRFNFTVDGNVSKDYIRELSQYECISVQLYSFDYQNYEIIPIKIRIMVF